MNEVVLKEKKQKTFLQGIFVGIGICIVFGIVIMFSGFYAYKKGFFDQSGNGSISFDRDDTEKQITFVSNENAFAPKTEQLKEEGIIGIETLEENNEDNKIDINGLEDVINQKIEEKIKEKEELIRLEEERLKKEQELLVAETNINEEVNEIEKIFNNGGDYGKPLDLSTTLPEENEVIVEINNSIVDNVVDEKNEIKEEVKKEIEKAKEEKKAKKNKKQEKPASNVNQQQASNQNTNINKPINPSNPKDLIRSKISYIVTYNTLKQVTNDTRGLDFFKNYIILKGVDNFDIDDFFFHYEKADIINNKISKKDIIESVNETDSQLVNTLNTIKGLDDQIRIIENELRDSFKKDSKGNYIIETCFYQFCSENSEEYNYIKNAILKDQQFLGILKEYKQAGDDPKKYLTIIIIENLRHHTTYKGFFKSVFLKYKTPQLSVMSKFSYGMYGIKTNFMKMLINNNFKEGNIFSIGSNPTLDYIKNNFFYFHTASKTWTYTDGTGEKFIERLIKNKRNQTNIINAYFKMIRQGWKTKGLDLYEPKNIGYLLTLYNIGKLGEPKINPQFGGSTLGFLTTKRNFGELSNIVFNSLELLHITNEVL